MTTMTVTEALAEIKTIEKRVAKKQQFVIQNLVRQEKFRDPFEADGGSATRIEQERQSISDLNQRKVDIRRAVQESNAKETIEIDGEVRSIADWLVWRREVAPELDRFMDSMINTIVSHRQDAQRRGFQVVTTADVATRPDDLIVNVSEYQLSEDYDHLEQVLGALDGQLSLKNATIFIEV